LERDKFLSPDDAKAFGLDRRGGSQPAAAREREEGEA